MPGFSWKTDYIGTGKDCFTSFMRLFVLHVGEVRHQSGMTEVFLNRIPAWWQSNISKRAGLLRIKVLFHMTMAHGHPEEPLGRIVGQGVFNGSPYYGG